MSGARFTGRGDLIRWMQRCRTEEERRLAGSILGYELTESAQQSSSYTQIASGLHSVLRKSASSPKQEEVLKCPPERFYALAYFQRYADPEQLDVDWPPILQGVEPLTEQDLKPFAAGDTLQHQPIVPNARLNDFLRHTLSQSAGLTLDIPQLVRRVARLQTIYRLPRKPRILPAGRIYLLLDLNKRLLPFWLNAYSLCESVLRQHGRQGLEIRVIDDDPQGDYWDWFDEDQQIQAWRPISSQSTVLIISDMGQLAGLQHPVRAQWDDFLKQLRYQRIDPIVLAPLSPAQQTPSVQQSIRQILWNKQSNLRPQKIDPDLPAFAGYVRRALGLISIAVHVEPELLRAILGCLPAQQADSGVEAAVWLHPDVQWGYTALTMHPDKRSEYQAWFRHESAAIQRQVLSLIKAQHIGQFQAVWAEEVINAKPLVNFPLEELADVNQAEAFMLRFAKTMAGAQAPGTMQQYARRHLQRLGEEANRYYRERYTSTLYGLAYREQLRAGALVPDKYDASLVQTAISVRTELTTYSVWQVGEDLCLIGSGTLDVQFNGGVRLGEFDAIGDIVTVSEGLTPDDTVRHVTSIRLPGPNYRIEVVAQLTGQTITLDSGLDRLTVAPFVKPNWAVSIMRENEGLFAELIFAGQLYLFRLVALEGPSPNMGLQSLSRASDFYALGEGTCGDLEPKQLNSRLVDKPHWLPLDPNNGVVGRDQYGLYADLSVNDVTQRFRWIEPGSFMMGSPPDEAERYDDETQHQVTLTQGYWLADTAVTQAFWLAVMGDNPSSFKDDPQNPVEQVSWDDAQTFIGKLNELIPSLQAQLPTEAQWEYACRAGTRTPFSFGDNITPEQVNYDGDRPYAGGAKGLDRGKTVPVKSLPANPWGLYEMHGNVWEWCADAWQEDLGSAAAVDPLTQGVMGAYRVVRGGSWIFNGRFVRSAIRFHYAPVDRNYDLGFRLSLGHAELQPAEGGAG